MTYGISTTFATGDHYALGSKTIVDSLRDVPDIILAAYGHFFITQPELLLNAKVILLVICIVGGICFVSQQLKSGPSQAGLSLILFLLLPLATKALFFISTSTNYFIYRYNPGLQYAYLFFAVTALQYIDTQGRRWIAILGHGLILFLLLRFIQADLVYQGLHLRGVQHDLAVTNRILARVESLPTLDFDKEYRIFFYGDLPQARKDWFETGDPMPPVIDFWPNRGGPNYHAIGAQHAYDSFPSDWTTESAFSLLGTKIKMKPIGGHLSEATEKVEAHLASKPQGVWPAHDSVFIIDDIIVIRLKR